MQSSRCTTDARMVLPHDDVLQRISTNKLWSADRPLRLHLGCGENHFDGYVNIDYPPGEHNVMVVAADIFANITELDFPPNSVDEIRLHHVFEHFNRVTALALLIRWHTWLKTGGKLHIETPDLMGSAKILISDSSWKTKTGVVRHIAGDQSAAWAYHIDHWFPERFEHTLKKLGYTDVKTIQNSWPCEPYLSNVTLLAVKSRDISLSEHLTAADEILWESTVADSEKPTFEIWRKQLRSVLGGQIATAPVDIELPDISTITQAQSILIKRATSLPLSEIHNFNQHNRDKWVQSKAANMPAGSRVLDIGAGTCPYRSLFSHCDYRAHDFKQYTGVKLGGTSDYGKIDYESDINHIPVPDSSFDAILCTEVLEHAPEPIEALREMSRILKPGGRLLLTAPLGSGLHQLPFHYYGGFTPEWYKLFCERFGFAIKEIMPNGGFFKLLAQECARVSWTMPNHKHLHENPDKTNHLFGDWLPRYLFALEDKYFIDQFTVGYHVEAIKQGHNVDTRSENPDASLSYLSRRKDQPKAVGIIFSKDRAMQLDGTLRSLFMHCKDKEAIDLNVLYTTSQDLYEREYQRLFVDYPSVSFIKEKDFKADLLSLLPDSQEVLFLVDDNIFVRDFHVEHAIDELRKTHDSICFSLRLGNNTDCCYMLKKQQAIPKSNTLPHGICQYEWISAEYDFGYPLEVSSSIYRVSDLFPLLRQLDYSNPNTLELALDNSKHFFQVIKKSILCFENSVTFCNPINMVQTLWKNRAGENSSYSPRKLAEMYDEGYRIDVERFSSLTPNSCHQEVDLKFVKRESPINEHVKPSPLLSILILNYNGLQHLQPCLDSIKRNTPENHEIVIIDNSSTDGSLDYLRSCQDIILVENTKNLGCPPARAQLLSIARGKFVIFLDNDTIVTKDWAKKYIDYADSDPAIGMIGPISNYVSGAQLIPNAQYTNVEEMERFAAEWAAQNKGKLMPTIRLVGFCMFITRELINKIGNIDATFGRFGFEDDDYTWRANIAGFKTVIANDVFIHHTGGPQGRGDSSYNQFLIAAWDVVKKKWKLPENLRYGQPFDLKSVLERPFDKEEHYIPLMDPCFIENAEIDYRESLHKNWEIYKKKWRIPADVAYGAPYDMASVVKDCFIPAKHYCSLTPEEYSVTDGEQLFGMGDIEGAKRIFEQVLSVVPNSIEALNNLGVIAFQQGEIDEAGSYFNRVLEIDPNYFEAIENLGKCAEAKKDYLKAAEWFERTLKLKPDDISLLNSLGNCFIQTENLSKAKEVYKKLLGLDGGQEDIKAILRELERLEEYQHSLPANDIEMITNDLQRFRSSDRYMSDSRDSKIVELSASSGSYQYNLKISLDLNQFSQKIMWNCLSKGQFYEQGASNFLASALREGDSFIDIGSHIGYFSLLASIIVGSSGQVFAIEPEPSNFDQLTTNISLNKFSNIKTFNLALGSKIEQKQFFINKDNDGGHALWNVGLHPFNKNSRANPVVKNINTATLDSLFEENNPDSLKLIKIDVEGSECAILQGGANMIARHNVPYIICEINRFALQQMGTSEKELRHYMELSGYETYLLHDETPYFTRLSKDDYIETNYVFNVIFSKAGSYHIPQ